jgi:zinc/manganese transport system substrate-binding protein
MNNTPDSPAKPPDDRMDQGGNNWTLFTPGIWKVLHAVLPIKEEHVRAYFFENSNDPRLVRQIAGATGAEPGGVLYVEALSTPDGPAPTYAAMFRRNVDELTRAMKQN